MQRLSAYLGSLLFGVLRARCLLLLGLLLLFLLLGRWAKVFAGYLLVLGLFVCTSLATRESEVQFNILS